MNLPVKIIVLTGYGSIATAIEAVKSGAFGYMSKPADVDEILAAFDKEEINDNSLPEESTDLAAPSLARAEWEHINRVLADCSGNITKAAKKLGLHRRSLQRKLLKYPPKF
jgi:two-component system response regulator RegA